MKQIALTGNRFSGEDMVGKLFERIGVPVFDADTVLKFILNFRTYVDESIKTNIGTHIYTAGFIDPHKILSDVTFDKILDLVEFELFETFNRFKEKHKKQDYVIFLSSIIFERNWDKKFDAVINTFSPKDERVYRGKMELGLKIDYIHKLLSKESPELEKNQQSSYVLHNYENAPDTLKQAKKIDSQIRAAISRVSSDKDIMFNKIIDNNISKLIF